jgi:replicative DNA helicase
VLFVYRPVVYAEQLKLESKGTGEGKRYLIEVNKVTVPAEGFAEIIVAKNRNGAIGKVPLACRLEQTSFENFADEQQAEVGF